MKKYLFVVAEVLVACTLVCVQQAAASPLLDPSETVAAPPPSNIDFLKRSLGSSDISATGSFRSAGQDEAATATQKTTTTEASSQPVQNKSAAVAAPRTSTPNSGAVLEMPLSSGKVVTTRVPTRPRAVAKKAGRPSRPVPSVQPVVDRSAEDNTTEENAQAQEEAAQAELEYAARMLRQEKQLAAAQGRFIPQAASRGNYVPAAQTAANAPYNPNDYRPGVEWQRNDSTHFIIYTQKRDGGIGSSNMSMLFETAYATLRRNIPWMMTDKVRVFVYQDHTNYLKHEPNAKAWTRALAYPTRGEIVVYDEPGKQQELQEVFTHELVHVFTQKFFDKHKTGRLITPTWLDEGLAVYMEDQAYNGSKGGPWSKDLKTLNLQRDPKSQTANFSSSSLFGSRSSTTGRANSFTRKGKTVFLMPFDQFMQENSLSTMEASNRTQDWYLQAYAMVRFLLNPAGGSAPSNRMQFEQFTRLIADGEQVRDPASGFPIRDSNGKPMYRPYSAEKAMARAYRYNSPSNFEDAFWRWINTQY